MPTARRRCRSCPTGPRSTRPRSRAPRGELAAKASAPPAPLAFFGLRSAAGRPLTSRRAMLAAGCQRDGCRQLGAQLLASQGIARGRTRLALGSYNISARYISAYESLQLTACASHRDVLSTLSRCDPRAAPKTNRERPTQSMVEVVSTGPLPLPCRDDRPSPRPCSPSRSRRRPRSSRRPATFRCPARRSTWASFAARRSAESNRAAPSCTHRCAATSTSRASTRSRRRRSTARSCSSLPRRADAARAPLTRTRVRSRGTEARARLRLRFRLRLRSRLRLRNPMVNQRLRRSRAGTRSPCGASFRRPRRRCPRVRPASVSSSRGPATRTSIAIS